MISVAIIGVLASVATVAMSTDPDIEDEANKIAALVNEASRLAISGGTVNPAQSMTGLTARGRLLVRDDGQGQYLVIQRLDDSTAAFTDIERKRVQLGRRVRIVGIDHSAGLISGGSPDFPFIPPFGFAIHFRPDGTSAIEPVAGPPTGATLYLQDTRNPNLKARVVILPLNGMMTQMFSGW